MKILVIDDDDFMLEMIGMALNEEGHTTHKGKSVDEAISLLEQEKDFDVVITDIVMPEKDGTALINHIHSSDLRMPVLAITGGMGNDVDDYVTMANLKHTLQKPFSKKGLVLAVQQMLATV
ncbi:MAG: response regulator [Alphaproteobacteria bacterium]|nr:response regulator [Alphaproteobacteria bacterium]